MTAPTNPAPAGPATRALTPLDEVRRTLMSEESKKQYEMALPPQMKPEKFIRVAITAVNKTPELLDCTRQSLYQSFILAAQDGLLPDGREAAIVKFNNKGVPTATYMPMVGGLLKKIRNSGELKSIVANVVHQKDEFAYWVDEQGEHMKHVPLLEDDNGPVTHVYALAKTKDDGVYITVMSRKEVEKVRNVSKAKDAMAWTSWWDQMAEKTAIRRLAKRLPMSTDLEDFFRRDDERTFDADQPHEAEHKAAKGAPGRLEKLMGEPGKVIEGTSSVVEEHAPKAAEAGALQCSKCEFNTNDKQAISDHMQGVHGLKAGEAA